MTTGLSQSGSSDRGIQMQLEKSASYLQCRIASCWPKVLTNPTSVSAWDSVRRYCYIMPSSFSLSIHRGPLSAALNFMRCVHLELYFIALDCTSMDRLVYAFCAACDIIPSEGVIELRNSPQPFMSEGNLISLCTHYHLQSE